MQGKGREGKGRDRKGREDREGNEIFYLMTHSTHFIYGCLSYGKQPLR